MSAREYHEMMTACLREKSYERIEVKRIGTDCYLLITIRGKTHAYVDRTGKRKEYRHAWQAREWLEKTFGIDSASVSVETIKP